MADQNGEMTFIELLAEEDNGICIPRIQRDYAQGRPEVKSIRDDFLSAIHGTIVNPDGHLSLDFIYGTRDKRGLFIPLDGQQRLTTLSCCIGMRLSELAIWTVSRRPCHVFPMRRGRVPRISSAS